MNLSILKKDSVLISIGILLMLFDFDDVGIIFIIIVLVKQFIKTENKLKFVLEGVVFSVGFLSLMFLLFKFQSTWLKY